MTRSRDLANLADGVEFLAADHTKLDGIEASATADQTDAEIRTAVEAASDSNVFTDADHSKLNAIEASATADQTNAEIRAAVEAATDSNVFTDADHSKLNAVEASADVTDTTNVTAAGALMDSELTNLAAVKAINQSLVTTASPVFAGLDTTGNLLVGNNDTIYAENNIRFKSSGASYIDHNTVGQSVNFRVSGSSSNDTNALTILSSGHVGIGGNPDDIFHVSATNKSIRLSNAGNSNVGLELYNGNSKQSSFTWGNGGANLEIKNFRNDSQTNRPYGNIDFYTGGSNATSGSPDRRMRIRTDGSVLFGGITDKNVFNDTSGTGASINNDAGEMQIKNASDTCLYLNRTGSDGTIVSLRKNGSPVGSIGVADGDNLIISSTASAHGGLKFNNTAMAAYVDGASSDGTMSIGTSAVRFKDLYLSGGVKFDATGEFLNDYEEGNGSGGVTGSSGGTATTTGFASFYTKIGRMVQFQFECRVTDVFGVTGSLRVELPFTSRDYSAGALRCYNVTFDGSPFMDVNANGGYATFLTSKSGTYTQSILSTGYYFGSVTYAV